MLHNISLCVTICGGILGTLLLFEMTPGVRELVYSVRYIEMNMKCASDMPSDDFEWTVCLV